MRPFRMMTFLFIGMIVHQGMALALASNSVASEIVGELPEPRLCFLPKERTLVFPPSLSLAQRGYLSEMCDKVLQFDNRLIGANPMAHPAHIGSMDFERVKSLYELDRQHVANMSQLIEQAMAIEPFPEASFWTAWISERNTYREASSPLVRRQADYIVEKSR